MQHNTDVRGHTHTHTYIPRLASYAGKMWLCGGQGQEVGNTIFDDVWTSEDGHTWSSAGTLPTPRWGHSFLSYLGFMFIVGGGTPSGNYSVLYSDSGTVWSVMPSTPKTVANRMFQATAIYSGGLFVTGGETPGRHPTFLGDVWAWQPCATVDDCAHFNGRATCYLHSNLTAACRCLTPYSGSNCTGLTPFPPYNPPRSNNDEWVILGSLSAFALVLLACIVVLARRRRLVGACCGLCGCVLGPGMCDPATSVSDRRWNTRLLCVGVFVLLVVALSPCLLSPMGAWVLVVWHEPLPLPPPFFIYPHASLNVGNATAQHEMVQRDLATDWLIPARKLKIDPEPIAAGGFAQVFKARFNGKLVAVKQIHGYLMATKDRERLYTDRFQSEAIMMAKLHHPNIQGLLGVCLEPRLCLVTEFAPFGSLADILDNVVRLDELGEDELVKIAFQIAAGMHFLHTRSPKITHRCVSHLCVCVWGGGGDQYCLALVPRDVSSFHCLTP